MQHPLMMKEAAEVLNLGPRKMLNRLKERGDISRKNGLPRRELVQQGIFKVEVRYFMKGETDFFEGIKTPYSVILVTELGLSYLRDVFEDDESEDQAQKNNNHEASEPQH